MMRRPGTRVSFFFAALFAAAMAASLATLPARAEDSHHKNHKKEYWKGQPEFNVGESRGYFIWGDQEGFHVRWLSKGAKRTFSGNVTADVELNKFTPVSRDEKDYIKQNGERTIKWDARAKEGMDGFDFRPGPSTKALKFELYIDQKAAPTDEVKIGRNKTRATSVPVVINLAADELKDANIGKVETKK